MSATEMWQWWGMCTEEFRKVTLHGIPNCLSYGLVKSQLPPAAVKRVEEAYEVHREYMTRFPNQPENL